MRRFLMAFMVLIILTPSLVCAMPYCDKTDDQKSMVSMSSMTHEQPCASHDMSKDAKSDIEKGMLVVDCMSLDFQAVENAVFEYPNLEIQKLSYALYTTSSVILNAGTNAVSIRAPPDFDTAYSYKTPVFITTQRIRL